MHQFKTIWRVQPNAIIIANCRIPWVIFLECRHVLGPPLRTSFTQCFLVNVVLHIMHYICVCYVVYPSFCIDAIHLYVSNIWINGLNLLNLSILVSRGTPSNLDFVSSCEWTQTWSLWQSVHIIVQQFVYVGTVLSKLHASDFWKDTTWDVIFMCVCLLCPQPVLYESHFLQLKC